MAACWAGFLRGGLGLRTRTSESTDRKGNQNNADCQLFYENPCMRKWPAFRDIALFAVGLLGVIHETLLTDLDRPSLLVLYAAMMGLPAFLQADEKRER